MWTVSGQYATRSQITMPKVMPASSRLRNTAAEARSLAPPDGWLRSVPIYWASASGSITRFVISIGGGGEKRRRSVGRHTGAR